MTDALLRMTDASLRMTDAASFSFVIPRLSLSVILSEAKNLCLQKCPKQEILRCAQDDRGFAFLFCHSAPFSFVILRFSFVILSEAKNLCLQKCRAQEILRFAQDDRRFAQDDRRFAQDDRRCAQDDRGCAFLFCHSERSEESLFFMKPCIKSSFLL